MKHTITMAFAAAVLAACAASPAGAQERFREGLMGAGAGALVGGPVGAVVGGATGYIAGPGIARSIFHRRHYIRRRHVVRVVR